MVRSTVRALLVATAVAVSVGVPSVEAASLDDFGRCLSREGATFYGASWCGYCRKQKETLGAAMSGVRYVECSINGRRDQTAPACTEAGIRGFPTWVFKDGGRASGHQSLSSLAARTGCSLPSKGAGTGSGSAKPPSGGAKPSGPKVIEIPQGL